ncbi:hypothetical protein FOA52_004571 [Chlamydomonas sp. UWO 241]|nr:hypothetical protein FOA52_004571 [Chlamydomonas sp. UWO 241]
MFPRNQPDETPESRVTSVGYKLVSEFVSEMMPMVKCELQAEEQVKRMADQLERVVVQLAGVQKQQERMEQSLLVQRLQWAIQNAEHCKFEHKDYDDNNTTSAAVVRWILHGSLRNQRSCIQDYFRGTNDEIGREAFRAQLTRQLYGLTGVKPTLWEVVNSAGAKQWFAQLKL